MFNFNKYRDDVHTGLALYSRRCGWPRSDVAQIDVDLLHLQHREVH